MDLPRITWRQWRKGFDIIFKGNKWKNAPMSRLCLSELRLLNEPFCLVILQGSQAVKQRLQLSALLLIWTINFIKLFRKVLNTAYILGIKWNLSNLLCVLPSIHELLLLVLGYKQGKKSVIFWRPCPTRFIFKFYWMSKHFMLLLEDINSVTFKLKLVSYLGEIHENSEFLL